MQLTADEQKIEKLSKQWLKKKTNRAKIKKVICDDERFPSENNPVTIFMAGTPGAGKTEFSKSLIATFSKPIIRIDADEIRDMMKEVGYNGSNAHIFQSTVTAAVSNLYSSVVKRQQSVLIDGTFSYENWRLNVETSLQNNRLVEIYYLYQDPVIAWEFVKKREKKQGRRVPLEVFIDDYFKAMENVRKAKDIYGKKITVYFAKNNYKKDVEYIKVDVANIENHVPKMYTREELVKCLHE
jgi:UDP-N-acetylglucosamine kinase